jgi:hypothetical protein
MGCSPLLEGVEEPLDVLEIVSEHPILLCSEPPQTFRKLYERGWVAYGDGRWRITDEGRSALDDIEVDDGPPRFFEL